MVLSGCRMSSNLTTMTNYKLQAAPTALSEEQNSQKEPKANRIDIGVDAHLKSYQAARKIDNGAVGVAQTFQSQEALLLYVQKQREQAKQVTVVYESGPMGFTLYRQLKANAIQCLVCAPRSAEQKRKRRKNNSIDARTLTSDLSNYLNGNEQALQLVRIPTEAQEQARVQSRQHDALVQERKRIGAMGNALLLSQGYGSWSNWWRPKAFERLSQAVAPWIIKHLGRWVGILRELDQQIQQAKVELTQQYQGPRPKGMGAASLAQLKAEVLDWNRYSTERKIGCLAGMVPSEWSTGESQRLGAITKVGVPAIRRIITEMVWRMILFQPQYKAVQKWRELLEGSNRGLKKKAVVAIGRRLIVDIWRLQTGRITAQELGLIMIEG
jgi:transposase